MDPSGPATAFQALSDKKTREAALRQLTAGIDIAEWRILQEELTKKIPRQDILGCLPAELAAMVCSYLSPADIYSGKRVRFCYATIFI